MEFRFENINMSAQLTPSQLLSRYKAKPVVDTSDNTSNQSKSQLEQVGDVGLEQGNINWDLAITQPEALDLLEQAISEVERSKLPTIIQNIDKTNSDQSPLKKTGIDLPTLDQSPISSTRKESEGASMLSIEQGANVQVVEVEKSPELSPEVEKYLQEVHDDKDQAPKEIAIADEIANLPTQNQFVSEPVIVVPITPEIEKKGKRKSPKFSIRWLVEWSQKIIKMFAGKVIYLEPVSKD